MQRKKQIPDEVTQEDEYLDYKGVCSFLKIAYGTARNWKSQGKLPFTSFNGKVLFPKKEILKQLKRNRVKSIPALIEQIK